MPRVSMWLVRAALVYLLLGFTLGAVMLAGKALGHSAWIAGWIPIHVELVLVGWMLQLAMGVALWILPRFGAFGPARQAAWAWAAGGLLNAGVALVVTGAPFPGRVLELGAALAFGLSVWTRVRASGISAM
ncbi:MAG TPA: hypothetical protein VFD85_07965 [Gemmatimonadales bacterium]|nr:hypothetical protein [Gemmatimonadales bacterium]